MSTAFQTFKDLHQAGGLLTLPNIWDAGSALLLQEKQFPAIATSSMAVANSLGYGDGEEMSFEEYLFVIRRILAAIQIPLSVDLETGYGRTPEEIYERVLTLVNLGVAGINIEDSAIGSAGRTLQDAVTFARTITYLKERLTAENQSLFINVRCDTFLLGVADALPESLRRIKLYETTGADGIFLPCIREQADIVAAVGATTLPLNVMCIPGLPDFDMLRAAGVKRVSMGGFLYQAVYNQVGALSDRIDSEQHFAGLFA
ncbi:isocitrate lyase/PEP mutase family protein [Chitinophaga nivalis]|uniref:Isocitrate lyase/phosphoenolpyruvate mutase family protein n=1 Tax=Chitinophaga nivalis TaxID=2991709 RepID=A0ABT3IPU5_9BACT|nr:isocitrate lyase/phosphoenolpyruvate mutase family protein [Chitinophaga nivalis]MCW3464393.1 isocitrate lyase/phosphoenolpyruvate mutase family protein [Chitinophaga nivalis]MCW3485916.1 isocitrate lyase/phosphoenolpyruvate mutase family protein [Chitinophaga nivalis]